MPLTGSVTIVTGLTTTSISLLATNPTSGTGPYSVQWQRSTDGTTYANISGATALALADTSLTPGTYYWYQAVFTDSLSATGTFTIPTAILTPHYDHGSEGIVRKEHLARIGVIKRH